MFQKNKADTDRLPGSAVTTIVAGTEIVGNIESANDLRIDGKVTGNITCQSKVVIGPDGLVEGTINSLHADILGHISGEVIAKESIQLRGKANVEGNIFTKSLSMEPGINFNGKCQMGGSQVVELEAGGSKLLSKKVSLVNAK